MAASIFKAYDVRATYPDPLNETAAWKVGFAAGEFLQRQPGVPAGKTVLVSRDMRPSSAALCTALSNGLRAAGADVVDLGLCDTSFIYFAVNHLRAIGGIQTTASHNAVNYNGFKVSGAGAVPIGATTGLQEIEAAVAKLSDSQARSTPVKGAYRQADLWTEYRAHVLSFLASLPKPLTVCLDALHGMGGKMIPRMFDGVPNLKIIPLNFDVGGPGLKEPNPLRPENMANLRQAVLKNHADLGACFDGDADRCILTDERGAIIGCDHLTAALCEHFLKQAPGAAVIYDLRSSKAVVERVRALGGNPQRSRVGHVFMKALLRSTGGIFGGELSGHFYFRDNFCADSGAIAFAATLSVLSASGQTTSQFIDPFRRYPQSGEINFRVKDKEAVLAAVKARYAQGAAIDELDGVTIDAWEPAGPGRGWWFNVRASNTEPLLRFNAEAKDARTLDGLLQEVTPMLGEREAGH